MQQGGTQLSGGHLGPQQPCAGGLTKTPVLLMLLRVGKMVTPAPFMVGYRGGVLKGRSNSFSVFWAFRHYADTERRSLNIKKAEYPH